MSECMKWVDSGSTYRAPWNVRFGEHLTLIVRSDTEYYT